MFGFLRPTCQTTDYRQAYARYCQYQRHHYGLLSLPALSYEAVLLYLLGVDSGVFPAPDAAAPTCCRLRSKVGLSQMTEAPLGEFCASFGLLLAAIKLEDDARDGAGLTSSVASWLLRRRLAAAQSYFEKLDPQFAATVRKRIADHLALENTDCQHTIADYSAPTAIAFRYVFGLLGGIGDMQRHRAALEAIGEQVGRAIIAYDCAVDWHRDRRQGDFNPLPDEQAVEDSLRFCTARLHTAAQICRFNFGERAVSAGVLMSVARRVEQRISRCDFTCASLSPRHQLAKSNAVYTFMDFGLLGVIDGCCEVAACCDVAACCEAGAGGGEAACGAAECCVASGDSASAVTCSHCGCDVCCCGCEPCFSTDTKKKQTETNAGTKDSVVSEEPPGQLEVGMWGVAKGALRPTGKGVFDGQIINVTTEGDYIDSGTKIQVVEIAGHRIVVRAV